MAENNSTAKQEKKNFWQSNNKFWAAIKEWIRKQLVSLKRKPQRISMFFIVLSMVIYTLYLKPISQVSSDIGTSDLGLIAFWTTLLSILVCVLYMNVYPVRQKPRITMFVLTMIFLAGLLALDIWYYLDLGQQLASGRFDSYVNDPNYPHIATTQAVIITHAVLVSVSVVLCATKSIYGKLLKKINTHIDLNEQATIESVHVLEGDVV